jgi:hypothetical protein
MTDPDQLQIIMLEPGASLNFVNRRSRIGKRRAPVPVPLRETEWAYAKNA